jgi:hypothetical protein
MALLLVLVRPAAAAATALRLLHYQSNWDTADALAATQRPVSFGTVSDGRGRGKYRASLVVDAAAASAATATATTAVLIEQLRKLQPNKSGGLVGRVVATHAPNSHRVVTPLDHTHRTRQPYVPRIGRPGVAAAGVITSSATTSLSLSRSLVTQARRPRAQPTRAEHARVGTEAQAGGRVSAVQWLRSNQVKGERHGIDARRSKHCVQVFSSLSLSLCPSPSPYLSLHSLSLSRRSQT